MVSIWQYMESHAAFNREEQTLRALVQQNHLVVTNEMLANYCNNLCRLKMDNHILICGNNGSGKSWTGEDLALSFIDKNRPNNNFTNIQEIFRNYSTLEIARDLCKNERRVFVVDELSKYMHYMGWNTEQQKALVEAIEVARERKNVMIGCTREPHKINLNYRDGKVHTVIMLLDREEGEAPFGIVLHSWVYIEQQDKFRFEDMKMARGLRELLEMAEENSMFLGFYFGRTMKDNDKKFDVKAYTEKKMNAIDELGGTIDRLIVKYAEREEYIEALRQRRREKASAPPPRRGRPPKRADEDEYP